MTKQLLGKLAVYSTVFHFLRLSTLLRNICCFARMWNDVRSSVTPRNFPFYSRVHSRTSVYANLLRESVEFVIRATCKQLRRMSWEREHFTVFDFSSIFVKFCRLVASELYEKKYCRYRKVQIMIFWEIYWDYWNVFFFFTVICEWLEIKNVFSFYVRRFPGYFGVRHGCVPCWRQRGCLRPSRGSSSQRPPQLQ